MVDLSREAGCVFSETGDEYSHGLSQAMGEKCGCEASGVSGKCGSVG